MNKDVLMCKAKKILNENSYLSEDYTAVFIKMDENDFDHAAEKFVELCEETQKEMLLSLKEILTDHIKHNASTRIFKALYKINELLEVKE